MNEWFPCCLCPLSCAQKSAKRTSTPFLTEALENSERLVFNILSLNTSPLFPSACSTQMCSFAQGREWWRRKKEKGGLRSATETNKTVRRFRVYYQS